MKELFKRRFPFLRYKEKDVCAMCIYDTTKEEKNKLWTEKNLQYK